MIEKKILEKYAVVHFYLNRICSYRLPLRGDVDWESTGSCWCVGGHVEKLYDQRQSQQQQQRWQHEDSTMIKRVRLIYVAVGGVCHVSAACWSAVMFWNSDVWTCCWHEKCKEKNPPLLPFFFVASLYTLLNSSFTLHNVSPLLLLCKMKDRKIIKHLGFLLHLNNKKGNERGQGVKRDREMKQDSRG